MELQQAKLFHQELKRVESVANNSRSIAILVAIGLLAYLFLVGFFIGFETMMLCIVLFCCVFYWLANLKKVKKYTEVLDSYCWSNLGKSYRDAKYSEFLQ